MYNCRHPLFVSYPTFVSYAVGSPRRPSSFMQTMQQPQMTGVMLVNNWTGDVNDILDKIRINSIVLSNEHKKTYFLLSSRIKWFRVPVIFLSALGSVFGIGLSPYLPQLLISEICSVMSLVVGLIGSIELFLAISTKMESELVQSKELYLLAIEIQKTLLLDMENRNGDGMAYLEDKFNVYSKLIENSYLLECKIMDELTPLPNEFQSKVPAKHSTNSWEQPRPSKMPVRRSKQAILDVNMMRKHRQVSPDSPSSPPSPLSPLTSDTNKLVETVEKRLDNQVVDVELPRPTSINRQLQKQLNRKGSNPDCPIVVSRRGMVRLVSTDPLRNSFMIPPSMNLSQLTTSNVDQSLPMRNSIALPPEDSPRRMLHKSIALPPQEESRMLRAMQRMPIESVLPEFQAVPPLRRCATSESKHESKPKSCLPHNHSYIDLQRENIDIDPMLSFRRPRRRSKQNTAETDELVDIEAQDIQRALMAVTPQISEKQLHIT